MITILLKFVASAALLFAFYRIVLRGKASYTVSRAYLLLLPVVSLLMSVLSFEVYTPAATEIIAEQFEPLTFTFDNESTAPVTVATLPETEVMETETQTPIAPVVEETVASKRTIVINWMALFEWAVPAISLILLLLAFWHIRKVLVIKSKMKIESTAEGYDLIRSTLVKTPFSFARTIFLPAGLNEHRESLIIRHERAHIAHRHYADVWFIEFLTRLFWFNPFVWLCRAELRNVHEFQADHDVIASHISINDYQTTLLEMVMNVSSPVVNGFNHSFIRQRFIEMKSTAAGTLGRLAKVVTLVWIAGLFCVFTFTACKTKPTKTVISQKFVIEGAVDEAITDSCYLIYFADDDYNIVDTPVACVPVIDKKFHFETDLDRLTVCRIRCIFPGGEICSDWIETFAAPGATFGLTVHNGYYSTPENPILHSNYMDKINREAKKVRKKMFEESPKPEGCYKSWTDITSNHSERYKLGKVDFCTDRTYVTLTEDDWNHLYALNNNFFLRDSVGNSYRLLGEVEPAANRYQSFVRGATYAFEPLPEGTTKFDLVQTVPAVRSVTYNDENGNERTVQVKGNDYVFMKDIRENPFAGMEPNFTLSLKTETSGISSFQLLTMEPNHRANGRIIADVELDENGEGKLFIYLNEPCMAMLQYTVDYGNVRTAIPLIPGENAEFTLKSTGREMVGNQPIFKAPQYEFDGDGRVYKDWNRTRKMFSDVREKSENQEKADSLLKEFQKKNLDKLGCALEFMMENHKGIDCSIYPEEILNNPMAICIRKRNESFDKYIAEKTKAKSNVDAAATASNSLRYKPVTDAEIIRNLSLAATVAPKSDHYTRIDGVVSPDIKDMGYMISIFDPYFEKVVETKKVNAVNREYTVYFNYNEPRLAVFAAIFPDSTICKSTVPIMIVPGEHGKLKVMNGTFDLTGGSAFYRQYGMAKAAYQEMNGDSRKLEKYLTERNTEEGTVMALIYAQALPYQSILGVISDKVKTGQFHRLFETGHYGPYYRKVALPAISLASQNDSSLNPVEQNAKFLSMFIYNFSKNIEWPATEGDFVMCVLGQSEVLNQLKVITTGKTVGDKPIKVVGANSVSEIPKCQILHVPTGEIFKLKPAIEKVGNAATLIVSNFPGALDDGSCINFVEVDEKIKFEVNQKAIEKRNMKINPILLNMSVNK